jgi:hypothetical protein
MKREWVKRTRYGCFLGDSRLAGQCASPSSAHFGGLLSVELSRWSIGQHRFPIWASLKCLVWYQINCEAPQPMTALVMLACHRSQTSPRVRLGSRHDRRQPLVGLRQTSSDSFQHPCSAKIDPISKCASFGSLGSGDTTGCNHLPPPDLEIWGMNVRSQRANSWLDSTRRIRSASPRHGDRKSSPEGSYSSGQFLSLS